MTTARTRDSGVRDRLRWRRAAAATAEARAGARRFTDGPYASVQLLLLAVVGLLGFGMIMALSTTIAASSDVNAANTSAIWTQVVRQIEFVVVGLPIFWVAMRMPPRAYRVLAYPMLAIALVALMAVLVPGVGVGVYGSRRWVDLGPLQLQPSEFAKVAMLIWGGDLLARKQQLGTLRRARHLFLPLLPGFVFVVLLVMLEPDLGTTCCFMLVLLGLLWMVGMPLRYFAGVLLAVAGSVTALAVAAPYRLARLTTFLHPFQEKQGSGFHTVEGLYALASGGVFGVGLGQGTSKYGWVPNANTDYVFAIIGEELGLLGCLAVLGLFALLAYTGIRIARRNADPFVRLTAGAATVWLCGQAIINIGYVTGLLPVTGIPLPFISAGGTSLLTSFFVLGMLTSFARHEPQAVAASRRRERLGTRSRVERWLRVPVPRPYVAPKRRSSTARTPAPVVRHAAAPPPHPRLRPVDNRVVPAARRPAAARPAPRTARAVPLRPTGTDGRPRRTGS